MVFQSSLMFFQGSFMVFRGSYLVFMGFQGNFIVCHGSWSVFMVFMVFQGNFSWFWTLVLGCLLVLYMNDQILVHKYISSQNGLILGKLSFTF